MLGVQWIYLFWDLHHFNTYFGTTNLSVNLILHIIANTNVSLRFHECLDPKTMFLVFQHFFFYFGFSGDFVSRKKNLCNEKKNIVAFNEIWASLGVIFFCVMSKRASRASKTFFWASFWGVKILYITALIMCNKYGEFNDLLPNLLCWYVALVLKISAVRAGLRTRDHGTNV